MTSYVAATMILFALSLGSAAGAAESDQATAPAARTIVLEREEITPNRLTLATGSTLTFRNTSEDTLRLMFRGKGDLKKKITCSAPTGSPPGPALDELIDMEGDELRMLVPSGAFPGRCTLAPGDYTFAVHPETDREEALTPPQGLIFAK